jgi:hypothetical protein
LDSELCNLNVNWNGLQSEADLDGIVNNITAIIDNSASKSELPRNKQSKSEWTPELDKLKAEMRTATAKYETFLKANNIKDRKRTSTECSPQEINFRSAKRMYQKVLRKSKGKAFENFCTINMNKDLFKSLKTLSISQNTSQVPTELVVDGRSMTEEEEIIKELGKSFFPSPKPISPEQEEIINTYANYKKASANEVQPTITSEEVEAAVFAINASSSPGTDGISISIIQEVYSLLADTLRILYNKCLDLKYYPKQWKDAKVTTNTN